MHGQRQIALQAINAEGGFLFTHTFSLFSGAATIERVERLSIERPRVAGPLREGPRMHNPARPSAAPKSF